MVSTGRSVGFRVACRANLRVLVYRRRNRLTAAKDPDAVNDSSLHLKTFSRLVQGVPNYSSPFSVVGTKPPSGRRRVLISNKVSIPEFLTLVLTLSEDVVHQSVGPPCIIVGKPPGLLQVRHLII